MPTTDSTAIDSPRARPSPSMVAATTPEIVEGRTTPRMTSHCVAPSASAPSLSSLGTVRNRSRLSDGMIGTTITLRIRPAVKRLRPVVCGAPKMPRNPNVSWRNGSMVVCTKGARKMRPKNPRITLGIAASISTSGPTTVRTERGASIARYSAMAIDSGTAMIIAIADVTAVP